MASCHWVRSLGTYLEHADGLLPLGAVPDTYLQHADGLLPLGAVEVGGEEEEGVLLSAAAVDAERQVGRGRHQLRLQLRQLLALLLRLLVGPLLRVEG